MLATSPLRAEEFDCWSRPARAGRRLLANMAAFKAHASFGFWRHAEVMGTPEREGAMGSLGKLTSVDDLPPDAEPIRLIALPLAESRPLTLVYVTGT